VHKYLRAIGFSKVGNREELQKVINEVVESTIIKRPLPIGYSAAKDIAADENDRVYAELSLDFAPNAGICVSGEFDENSTFLYEYYFPYLRGSHISSYEDITVERHAEKESYAGVCDDMKVGVSLIFYLDNMIPYKRLNAQNRLPIQGTSLMLSALSVDGTIMMPIIKNEQDKLKSKKAAKERNQLIAQARMGDEEAIENLTLDDMDTYSMISKKIQSADVYSLVDTYFMPYGVECDQYSILGEIRDVCFNNNVMTGEEIVFMTLECNELIFDVAINKEDLYGEPAVGRRFKGVIWLQGVISYPE
jgi:hypothetical protein